MLCFVEATPLKSLRMSNNVKNIKIEPQFFYYYVLNVSYCSKVFTNAVLIRLTNSVWVYSAPVDLLPPLGFQDIFLQCLYSPVPQPDVE